MKWERAVEEGGRALSDAWRLGHPGCSLGCVMGQETRPVGSAPWGLSGQRGGGGGSWSIGLGPHPSAPETEGASAEGGEPLIYILQLGGKPRKCSPGTNQI